MSIQNFCEVPQWLYAGQQKTAYNLVHKIDVSTNCVHSDHMNMKRQPLSPGTKRMYPPEYHLAIYNSKTIGEMVEAMYMALSASGYNNFGDAHPSLAKKCLAKINEAKHNTQEI